MPTTKPAPAATKERPARPPQVRDRDAEVAALASELQKPEVNWNISAAATNLGINYQRAWKLVNYNPHLRAMHPSKNPESDVPCQEDVAGRMPIMTPAEWKEIKALSIEAEKVAIKDWSGLGLDEVEVNTIRSMEDFSRMPLAQMMALTHGGLAKTFIGLGTIFDKYYKQILTDRIAPEFDQEGNPIEADQTQRMHLKSLIALSAEIRAVKEHVEKSNILKLKAEAILKEQNGGGKKSKPGFHPMVSVSATPGSTVIVNERNA